MQVWLVRVWVRLTALVHAGSPLGVFQDGICRLERMQSISFAIPVKPQHELGPGSAKLWGLTQRGSPSCCSPPGLLSPHSQPLAQISPSVHAQRSDAAMNAWTGNDRVLLPTRDWPQCLPGATKPAGIRSLQRTKEAYVPPISETNSCGLPAWDTVIQHPHKTFSGAVSRKSSVGTVGLSTDKGVFLLVSPVLSLFFLKPSNFELCSESVWTAVEDTEDTMSRSLISAHFLSIWHFQGEWRMPLFFFYPLPRRSHMRLHLSSLAENVNSLFCFVFL